MIYTTYVEPVEIPGTDLWVYKVNYPSEGTHWTVMSKDSEKYSGFPVIEFSEKYICKNFACDVFYLMDHPEFELECAMYIAIRADQAKKKDLGLSIW